MLALSRTERSELEQALRTTRDRRHWVRLRGVLLAAEGMPVAEIAAAFGAGPSTGFDWLAYGRAAHDPAALADAPRSGQPPRLKATHRERLVALPEESLRAPGYASEGWTVPLLEAHFRDQEGCVVSDTTLRRTRHALGYRWKRPRYVLARRDPERDGRKT